MREARQNRQLFPLAIVEFLDIYSNWWCGNITASNITLNDCDGANLLADDVKKKVQVTWSTCLLFYYYFFFPILSSCLLVVKYFPWIFLSSVTEELVGGISMFNFRLPINSYFSRDRFDTKVSGDQTFHCADWNIIFHRLFKTFPISGTSCTV